MSDKLVKCKISQVFMHREIKCVSADILRPWNVFWNGQDQPCANLVSINTRKLGLGGLCLVAGVCGHFETTECVVGICERVSCHYKRWGICIKVFWWVHCVFSFVIGA
jgi:hypothetical protein